MHKFFTCLDGFFKKNARIFLRASRQLIVIFDRRNHQIVNKVAQHVNLVCWRIIVSFPILRRVKYEIILPDSTKVAHAIGIYTQTADEQFFPYIRPQENGTKTDMRWWEQRNGEGFGLRVQSCDAFTASALHYNISDLDEGEEKHQRHSPDVPKSKYTELTLDLEHAGVGGIDSWSNKAEAQPPYRVEYKDRLFKFWLIPVVKK